MVESEIDLTFWGVGAIERKIELTFLGGAVAMESEIDPAFGDGGGCGKLDRNHFPEGWQWRWTVRSISFSWVAGAVKSETEFTSLRGEWRW